ncbi:mitochondrial ribosome-associated GTPase 1-like [Rhipicephalus microplus]|uniref:mitochondrial ribosome-associated GTPase 1-like n=1 Tax=Rhipicephalus microplus TaxID=6941 RepID=UPI002F2B0446
MSSSSFQAATTAFRKAFDVAPKNIAKWFPTHMYTGMKDMQRKLKSVDCVLELHDARVPLSGRNPHFLSMLAAIKPHVLLLNKADLADPNLKATVAQQLRDQGTQNVLHIRSTEPSRNVDKIVPMVADLIRKSERYNRFEAFDYTIMVIGIPNVGKSSLINALRKMHLGRTGPATRVGATAGVTMRVLERIKISEDPLMYLLDTPGILSPATNDPQTALQLALCGCMLDHLVGNVLMADYLLYWLNQQHNYSYVDYLGLDGPCDDIRLVLYKTAINMRVLNKVRTYEGWSLRPNQEAAAANFIQGFRRGLLGRITFLPDSEKGSLVAARQPSA